MAFCSNCGKEIAAGIKFCTNCGKAIGDVPNSPVVPAVPPQPVSAPAAGEAMVQPLLSENKKNRLVLIAGIIALAIGLFFLAACIISNVVIPRTEGYRIDLETRYGLLLDESAIESWNEFLLKDYLSPVNIMEGIVGPIVFLVVLVLITLLAFRGGKKNNKILVLIASILYFFSFLGIPSAILCIIAFVRMNKNTQVIKQK
jgi:hypothetical protein